MTWLATAVFLLVGSLVGILLLVTWSSLQGDVSVYRLLVKNYTDVIKNLFLALLFGGIIIYFLNPENESLKPNPNCKSSKSPAWTTRGACWKPIFAACKRK